ncbi:MAG: 50S ribosomal protein L31 [Thermomicrobiales bacterium]
MKTGLHPRYELTTVTCACGSVFETRSTRQNLRVDLCSVCHPFYTGEQRIVDTAGQVERFTNKIARAAAIDTQGSKRQQRINARAAQLAEEKRRVEEAQAAARAAQRDRARAIAEARAAAEVAATEAAGAAEAFGETAESVETEVVAEATAE